jgi:hypothetical protein
MRNFTTKIETWAKDNNLTKIATSEWRNHFRGLISKIVREKCDSPIEYV